MVHQYKLNGYNIVLDTASGSVHTVDEVAYDIIALYKDKSADEIVKEITEKYSDITEKDVLECLEDVKYLEENGKLYIVDFKTDRCYNKAELWGRYGVQLKLYSEAMAQVTGKTIADCMLYSFYMNDVVEDPEKNS